MTAKLTLGTITLTLALGLAGAAHAGGISCMEHYFRVSGAVNAAQGTCEVRADLHKLVELGKPYRFKERNRELEERMIGVMMKST